MPGAEYQVDLIINSNYKFIDIGHDVVKYLCNLIGFDEDTTHWIILAVREGISNAIKHGNKNLEAKKVDVKFIVEPDLLTVLVRDRGEGFDPAQLPDPLDPENLLNPAGRGIFFMRTFMDEVEYSTHPDGGIVVRMSKHKR